MNPEEARKALADSPATGTALTLGFDEPMAATEKPKVVRKRVTKKTAEPAADSAASAVEGASTEGSVVEAAAPARKPRAPRATKATAAKTAKAEETAGESSGSQPPTVASGAPAEKAVNASSLSNTAAPAPISTPDTGPGLVSQLASLTPTPRYAPTSAYPASPAPQAPAPHEPAYLSQPQAGPAATGASGAPEARYTRDPGYPAQNPQDPAASGQQQQPIPPYQSRGRYAPIDPANPGSRHSNQRYGGSFSGGPIQPIQPDAAGEGGAPPEDTQIPPAGIPQGNPEGLPLDYNTGDPRNFQRDPLRFRGGRAQMRADRNMSRGRQLRPGQPGYNQGQGGQGQGGQGQGGQGQGGQGQGGQGGQDAPQNGGNANGGGNRRREYDLLALEAMALGDLHKLAEEMGIEVPPLKKEELIHEILGKQAELLGNVLKKGILEILSDGKGFLRCNNYVPDDGDVYVSQSQIKRFNLKTGDTVTGTVRQPKEMERYHGLLRVEAINGFSPESMKSRRDFEKLTPIFPNEKFQLETDQANVTARIIDLVSPIGKGQRGLIVAPPKAGKTTLIKNVANSIMSNHPEVMLIVLLIDERPEEVTDISRSVRGEVVASTFDEMPENHMRVSDMVLEKAKRWVELKHDVVILLDSITRLSRASNLVVTPSGRTLSGGLDPAAMYRPKRMFGAARNIEEGGSLTILATALVDTGSRMDEMIFEEFKGTGNMDLVLDRNLFDQRIFPAIDINKSGTRRDDLLMSREDLAAIYHLRRTLAALDNDKAVTLLIDRLKNTKTNADFMQIVAKSRQNAAQ